MGASTTIRVISMVSAHERRARFSAEAAQAGLEWSYFDALRLPEAPLVHDPATEIIHTGRPLRPGEIGCYASHYSLWRWFIASNHTQLLVLEDDVAVDWSALRVLCSRDLGADGLDILKLFTTYPAQSELMRYKLFSDHSHLMRLRGYCYGTQAYMLSRRGAAALIRSCERLTMPIDWAMSRYWDYGIANYAVFPFPVLERFGPSSIGHAAAASRVVDPATLAQRLRRFGWRSRERIARGWVDWRRTAKPFGATIDASAPLFSDVDAEPSVSGPTP
ncbi:MAG TPA: glycosyltransferase family 25 protein [Burkholderiaceae bacterium]